MRQRYTVNWFGDEECTFTDITLKKKKQPQAVLINFNSFSLAIS